MVDTTDRARPRMTGSNARKTRAEEDALLALKYERYHPQQTQPTGRTGPVVQQQKPQQEESIWNPVRQSNPNYQGFMGIVNMVQDALSGTYNQRGVRGEKPR
jgi:hypothetical protein